MDWKITEARKRFSEVVRRTAEEPQRIYKRSRLVAVVVAAESYEAYERWAEQQRYPTMSDAIDAIRKICREEDYELERPNPRTA